MASRPRPGEPRRGRHRRAVSIAIAESSGTVPAVRLSASGRSWRLFWLVPGACPAPSGATTARSPGLFRRAKRPQRAHIDTNNWNSRSCGYEHEQSVAPANKAANADLPAAIIVGSAHSRLTAAAFREIDTAADHLRRVLAQRSYESHSRKGELMTAAARARLCIWRNHRGKQQRA